MVAAAENICQLTAIPKGSLIPSALSAVPGAPPTPQSSSLNQHRNELLLFLQDKQAKSGHEGVRRAGEKAGLSRYCRTPLLAGVVAR